MELNSTQTIIATRHIKSVNMVHFKYKEFYIYIGFANGTYKSFRVESEAEQKRKFEYVKSRLNSNEKIFILDDIRS